MLLVALLACAGGYLIYSFGVLGRFRTHAGPETAVAATDWTDENVKVLNWNLSRRGCTNTATLNVSADGTANYNARTTANDEPGRVWHESILLEDDAGKALFRLGPWTSPPLEAGDNAVRWYVDGRFPARIYTQIVKGVSDGDC